MNRSQIEDDAQYILLSIEKMAKHGIIAANTKKMLVRNTKVWIYDRCNELEQEQAKEPTL